MIVESSLFPLKAGAQNYRKNRKGLSVNCEAPMQVTEISTFSQANHVTIYSHTLEQELPKRLIVQ